jgi:hypothetical protein
MEGVGSVELGFPPTLAPDPALRAADLNRLTFLGAAIASRVDSCQGLAWTIARYLVLGADRWSLRSI